MEEPLGVALPANPPAGISALRPIAFVSAPQVDLAEAEGVPPGVEHWPIETQDAFASYACGGRCENGEAGIDTGAGRIAGAGEPRAGKWRIILGGNRTEGCRTDNR